jgi:hypothetical protein
VAGVASKLAGKLAWGGSHLFKKLGRAMLRPIFDQKSKRNGHVSDELLRSLVWWREILQMGISEKRDWQASVDDPVHLFCDAASTPPHLGAVLFIDKKWLWTHMQPPSETLQCFKARKDKQIMGLELLAISLGLATFDGMLTGRRVVVHTDNKGSEVSRRFSMSRCVACAWYGCRCL